MPDTGRYCVPIPYRGPIGGHVPLNSRMHCALSPSLLDYLLRGDITLHVYFGSLVPLKYPLGDIFNIDLYGIYIMNIDL